MTVSVTSHIVHSQAMYIHVYEGGRDILYDHAGAIGATFAVGACWSAKLRDRDDYKNAVVGGLLAGSIFGFRSKTCIDVYSSSSMGGNAVHVI